MKCCKEKLYLKNNIQKIYFLEEFLALSKLYIFRILSVFLIPAYCFVTKQHFLLRHTLLPSRKQDFSDFCAIIMIGLM